jgi:CHAD domain-containing protein
MKSSTALARHLAKSVRTMRRRYRKRLARCQENFSEAAVHNLRIQTRRMLALLDLLGALQIRDGMKKMRKVFKQRLDAFDRLRDTQVQLSLLRPLWRDFPETRNLDIWLRRRERRFILDLRHTIKAIRRRRIERRLKDLEKLLRKTARAGKSPMIKALAAAALTDAYARVLALRRRIRHDDTATIHRTRVAFKRFRYTSELLQPLFPRLTRKRLRKMQAFQSLMGDIQDVEVLLTELAQAIAKGHMRALDGRRLQQELNRRRQELITTFMTAVTKIHEFQPGKLMRRARTDN